MTRGKPFRPFLDMIHMGIPDGSWVTSEEVMEDLLTGRGQARLYLGHYTEEDIRDAFKRFSIQERLEELGLGTYIISLNASNPDSQELRVFPIVHGKGGMDRDPIAEVILREAMLAPHESLVAKVEPCPYLVIQWICLQNVAAAFEPERLLPGQKYPGLGVGNKVLRMLEALIKRLHLEGIVNRPEFLHNALMYSRVFQYVNPEAEGRLHALKRQLGHLSLWQIAWAAEKGCIIEDGEKKYFNWYQSEQVWTACGSVSDFFNSDAYNDTLHQAEARAAYTLAEDTPAELKTPTSADPGISY